MKTNKEFWMPVKRYEDSYEISNLGGVRSFNYKNSGTSRLLKGRKLSNGYRTVKLYNSKAERDYYIHRLVAEHFVPKTKEDREMGRDTVMFKDGDRTNLYYKNLQWATKEEVIIHNAKQGKYVLRKSTVTSLTETQAIEVKTLASKGILKGVEIAAMYNISPELVSHIKNERRRVYK